MFLNLNKFDKDKSLLVVLTSFYGVNTSKAFFLLRRFGLALDAKILDANFVNLNAFDILLTRDGDIYEQNLRRFVFEAIQNRINSGSYRGRRFLHGLPTKGQRTHSNAGTPRRLYRGKFTQMKAK